MAAEDSGSIKFNLLHNRCVCVHVTQGARTGFWHLQEAPFRPVRQLARQQGQDIANYHVSTGAPHRCYRWNMLPVCPFPQGG